MDGSGAWILMLSALAVLYVGVESQQRTCYFGPPPEPDPNHPGDWMKQVMQKVRERCPGRKQPTPAAHTTMGSKYSPVVNTVMGEETTPTGNTAVGDETTPIGNTAMGDETTPIGNITVGDETTPSGNTTPGCVRPLGLADGTIPDSRITASTSAKCCPASDGRLNGAGWEPKQSENSWIEVDLVNSTVVLGVITKGFGKWYVTQYTVAYRSHPSPDLNRVTDGNGDIQVFNGNTDGDSQVTNLFNESAVATIVRVEPTAWNLGVNLQVELLGCLP